MPCRRILRLPKSVVTVFTLSISSPLFVACGTTGDNWAERADSVALHNTPQSWVRTPAAPDAKSTLEVHVLRAGKETVYKNFAEALKGYKEGDEIRLKKGVYPFQEKVKVPAGVKRVLITGEGHDSILFFLNQHHLHNVQAEIETSVPITFRDVQLNGPVIRSTSSKARLWFEGAYVGTKFVHHGIGLVGGKAQVFIFGGFYSNESAFGKTQPPEVVEGHYPMYFASTLYTPELAKRDSHFEFHSLRFATPPAPGTESLQEFTRQMERVRVKGGFDFPAEALGKKAIEELNRLDRSQKLGLSAFQLSGARKSSLDSVILESVDRMTAYLFTKYSGGALSLPEEGARLLAKAEAYLKQNRPMLALMSLENVSVPQFLPEYGRYRKLVTQIVAKLEATHGCKAEMNVRSSSEPVNSNHMIRTTLLNVASLYPVAALEGAGSKCHMLANVYRYDFSVKKSEQNVSVTSEVVETDAARNAREAALAASSRDVWKEAFSTVGNAAMRGADRSREVWKNQEKTRTRVEERASGTYLISYKGNINVPAPKIQPMSSGASASSSAPNRAGTREKKTVRKTYFLYGMHEVEYDVTVKEGSSAVIRIAKTKNRKDTKRGPCVTESVDGWTSSLISGNCFENGLPRSGHIQQAMQDAMVAYLATKRLPKMVEEVRKEYAKGDSASIAEATLTAALYGGIPEGKGLEAVRSELKGVYEISGDAKKLKGDLVDILNRSQLI